MFYIRELIVSPEQEEHIWTRHRVTPEEVEDLCVGHELALKGRDGSYALYGQTDAGRYLVVIIYPRGRGIFALATARDMNEVERRRIQTLKHR
jgi:uncharacterized protein